MSTQYKQSLSTNMDFTGILTSTPEGDDVGDYSGQLTQYDLLHKLGDDQHDVEPEWPISLQQNISSEDEVEAENTVVLIDIEMGHVNLNSQSTRTHSHPHGSRQQYLQVGIPTFSNGLTTFAYQQVLRNRIPATKLQKHADYDIHRYTPTFIHDCLMFPGSLANLLNKISPQDIIPRMTPALLPGFRASLHCETGQPCIIRSDSSTDYVQGILIFGEGQKGRNRLRDRYRPFSRREKVLVELDVTERNLVTERFELRRRRIEAHAFLRRPRTCDIHSLGCPTMDNCTLESYIKSAEDDEESLRIDPSVYGIEEDGGVDLTNGHDGESCDSPDREVVFSGPGHLDYERVEEGWSGW